MLHHHFWKSVKHCDIHLPLKSLQLHFFPSHFHLDSNSSRLYLPLRVTLIKQIFLVFIMIFHTFEALIKYELPFSRGTIKFKSETSQLCPVNIFKTSFVSTSHNCILFEAVSNLLLSGIAKIAVTFSLPVFHLLK